MSKYNCGNILSLMTLYKKDIKGALRRVEIDHDNNKEYPLSKEEAEKLIIETFDDTVYQLVSIIASYKAIERIAEDAGVFTDERMNRDTFYKYLKYNREELEKLDEYDYDSIRGN